MQYFGHRHASPDCCAVHSGAVHSDAPFMRWPIAYRWNMQLNAKSVLTAHALPQKKKRKVQTVDTCSFTLCIHSVGQQATVGPNVPLSFCAYNQAVSIHEHRDIARTKAKLIAADVCGRTHSIVSQQTRQIARMVCSREITTRHCCTLLCACTSIWWSLPSLRLSKLGKFTAMMWGWNKVFPGATTAGHTERWH